MSAIRRHIFAFLAFSALALVIAWPLPLQLGTHLTGPPSGDTGVYVWNQWVFRHELEQGRFPFYTSSILAVGGARPVDLSLHNYTTFSNLLALPLLPHLGSVATFNTIYLFNVALAGYCAFLLARVSTKRDVEAWLGGAVFVASPVLVARSVGHHSLTAAAPLPIFVLLFQQALSTSRLRYAAGAGATVAWATFCDAYYGVFCVLLACLLMTAHLVRVTRAAERPTPTLTLAVRALDLLILIVASFILATGIRGGGGSVLLFGLRISMRTLYTPVLLVTALAGLRLMLTLRPRLSVMRQRWSFPLVRALAVAALVMVALLSPALYGYGDRVLHERAPHPATYWRSSPPGVDLLAFVMPNPNHPIWGERFQGVIRRWSGRDDAFPEFVGAVSLVPLGVIVVAWRRVGWLPTRFGMAWTILFAVLALGPFVHVAGMNTHVPTPWTLLRYAPVIGLVRSPSRFVVLLTLALAMMFAVGLARLLDGSQRRSLIIGVVSFLLALELVPAPRRLYSADVPPIYHIIANDPRHDIRVLGLPLGVRDGASSIGNYTALSQFYQTVHERALVGGYLSRVPAQRKRIYRRLPVLNALITLSEGRPLAPHDEARARMTADRFLTRARLGYVVIDRSRTSPQLADFAIDLLGLTRVATSGERELYVPRVPKPELRLQATPSFAASLAGR
jgi:hypothetical protein